MQRFYLVMLTQVGWNFRKGQVSTARIAAFKALSCYIVNDKKRLSLWQPCFTQAFGNALKLTEEHSVFRPPVAVL